MTGVVEMFGLTIASAIPLPAPPADRTHVDVEIRIGDVPATRADEDDASALLHIADVGRFWVRCGCEIIVEPAPNAEPAWLIQPLVSTVMAVLLHQRGVLTLHGSAVQIGRRAIVIAGDERVGKSTLVAHLAAHGHTTISDGFTAIVDTGTVPRVVAGPYARKLWPDSARHLGYDVQAHPHLAPGSAKRLIVQPGPLAPSLPLDTIFILDPDAASPGPVLGRQRVKRLRPLLFVSRLGWQRQSLQASRLLELSAHCAVIVLTRPPGDMPESLARMAECVVAESALRQCPQAP